MVSDPMKKKTKNHIIFENAQEEKKTDRSDHGTNLIPCIVLLNKYK
jgi:hypothetical protein